MSIAVSIFLSALFLGCVFLYIKSESKEKWRKYLLFLIGIPFVVFVSILLYLIIDEQIEKRSYKTEPQKETSIKGINLGDSLSDLQFKYGKFTKEDKQVRGYDVYKISENLSIWTKDSRVKRINYQCDSPISIIQGKMIQLPKDRTKLWNIECGSSGESIIEEHGKKNVEIKCFSNEDTMRFYGIKKKDISYILRTNKVDFFQSGLTQDERPLELKDCS